MIYYLSILTCVTSLSRIAACTYTQIVVISVNTSSSILARCGATIVRVIGRCYDGYGESRHLKYKPSFKTMLILFSFFGGGGGEGGSG